MSFKSECPNIDFESRMSVPEFILLATLLYFCFPGGSASKKICLQCGRPGFDPSVGKILWRKERLPLQYSGLEKSMDYIVHWVAKSQTQLSNFHFQKYREFKERWIRKTDDFN